MDDDRWFDGPFPGDPVGGVKEWDHVGGNPPTWPEADLPTHAVDVTPEAVPHG